MEFELLVSDVKGWVPTVAQLDRKLDGRQKPVMGWNQKDGIFYGLRIYGSFKSVIAINGLSAPQPVPDGMFQGTCVLITNPGTPTADEWWTATQVGVYTHFGGVEITTMTDVFNYIKWTQATGTWSVVTVAIPGSHLIQLQSDWNQTDIYAKDFIKNKPQAYVDRRTTKLLTGTVTWISGLTFQVSDLQYYLLGVLHTADAAVVNLTAGDETYDRIDVIYVDYFGVIGVHQGLPSSDPVKPIVDGYFELELTQVFVSATATAANIDEEIVYSEAVEWTGSEVTGSADVTVDFANIISPDTGTYNINVSKTGSSFGAETIALQKPGIYNALGSVLILRVRTNNPIIKLGIVVTLKLNSAQIGSQVIIHDGAYGFSGSSSVYQSVAIPFSEFNALTSQINTVQISFAGISPIGPAMVDFDNIKFQNGITPGITVETDPVFQAWLAGNPIPAEPSRIVELKIVSDIMNPIVGDGKLIFCVPFEINGMKLTLAHAYLTTSAAGTTTIQIRNITTAHDILSTPITIDTTEITSYTAVTPPVINATYQQVSTGDLIAIDVDTVAAASKGLGIILTFNK